MHALNTADGPHSSDGGGSGGGGAAADAALSATITDEDVLRAHHRFLRDAAEDEKQDARCVVAFGVRTSGISCL